MNDMIELQVERRRRGRFFMIALMLLTGISPAYHALAGSGSLALPLHELESSVQLPFPVRPELLEIFTEDGSRSAAYQYTDRTASFGYTATIMLDRIRTADSRGPDEWIDRTIHGILEAINGRVLAEESLAVDGRPGRYVFASMGIVDHQAISRTLIIYDNDRIHTWAMQDAPSITGELGSEVFLENIQNIRIGSAAESSLKHSPREGSHDVYRLGSALLPFPGDPSTFDVDMPHVETEALSFQVSQRAPLYMGLVLTGLPRVADPAYTFLRGSRFEKELLEVGDVTVAGIEAKVHIIREIGSETTHTYTVAWSYVDRLYVWSVHGDHPPGDQSVRKKFLESLHHIEVR